MAKPSKSKKPGKKKSHHVSTVTHKGRMDITRSGMGYVIVEGLDNDIIVKPQHFNTALHGDLVRVEVLPVSGKGKRLQGEIIQIIDRKQKEFIGQLQIRAKQAFFLPQSDKPIPDFFIPLDKIGQATEQDKVVVKITNWPKGKKPEGEVIAILDQAQQGDIAMKEILVENGFSLSFSNEVLEESAHLTDTISDTGLKKRKDFRNVLTFTIDPIDAKDFDDAISFQHLKNGNYEVGVHIADVSHFVTPESALDDEAYQRATSVYLPDRVVPMLPERISNELCSLRPHEDKFTFSAVFQLDKKGNVIDHWIGRTLIHSDHRFTYEEVQEIIEQKQGLHAEPILQLNEWAQQFRKARFDACAINFSSTEVRFKLDEKGRPIGIVVKESKEAHQLIEEFMLLANKYVAAFVGGITVEDRAIPFPYRVHDTPDEMKLLPFVDFAKKYGHAFNIKTPEGIASSFNNMLKAAKGKPEQHVLEQLGIRTMAKAVYTTENIGHYGLGFDYYCHFTSPIRRYPDVLVHRIVQSCLDKKISIDKKLEAKCVHCSERERAAMESERAGNKYKQVEYMANFLGDEFEGVVSGVTAFGLFVETVEHKCEGLISMTSLLQYDDFMHIETEYALVGRRSGKQFRMGDKLTIKVIAANLEKRQLDFEWVINVMHQEEEAFLSAQQRIRKTKSSRAVHKKTAGKKRGK